MSAATDRPAPIDGHDFTPDPDARVLLHGPVRAIATDYAARHGLTGGTNA